MIRKSIQPRTAWRETVESQGFYFHTLDGFPYWDETAYYEFTEAEIDRLESATQTLHELCLQAVDYVVRTGCYDRLRIPDWFAPAIEQSWRAGETDIYGRFDLVYGAGNQPPKMLEYNADTPTSLLECSVIQYHWLQEQFPQGDQFNSLHEALVERWSEVGQLLPAGSPVHFTCVSENLEDLGNVDYMRATAEQAGLTTVLLPIEQIGWDENRQQFVDEAEQPITHLFKLYPWEWLLQEPYSRFLAESGLVMKEPPWKLILSNKAVLPLLWELFPGHPNLLPAYDSPELLGGSYVKKPVFSREGANIQIHHADLDSSIVSSGPYESQSCVYQAFSPLPRQEGHYAVIGSWIVGGQAVGIGIREDASLITRNTSRFVPHRIV